MSMFANNALLGVGLGLGFGLENKERSKENPRHYYAFDGKLGHHLCQYPCDTFLNHVSLVISLVTACVIQFELQAKLEA